MAARLLRGHNRGVAKTYFRLPSLSALDQLAVLYWNPLSQCSTAKKMDGATCSGLTRSKRAAADIQGLNRFCATVATTYQFHMKAQKMLLSGLTSTLELRLCRLKNRCMHKV